MKHEPVIRSTALAVTTTSAAYTPEGRPINGVSADINATEADKVLVYTDPVLAGAETVSINTVAASGALVPVYNAAGAPAVLVAALQSIMLEGGFIYRLVKSVTASPTAVECYLKPRQG